MSLWNRLFTKRDLPQLEKLEAELETLLKKSNSEFLILVGISGNIKGRDIFTIRDQQRTSFSDRQLKIFAAKGAEFYSRFEKLDFIPPEVGGGVQVVKFYYNSDMQFYLIPVTESFMILSYNSTAIKILNNIDKTKEVLSEIKSGTTGE
ncbi:hypothetical protein GF325_17825 [Candidatus Bathyarchaeota archaeon]|nr:hypothetical protein [Candidatus Bathyarchaeota archaeon]